MSLFQKIHISYNNSQQNKFLLIHIEVFTNIVINEYDIKCELSLTLIFHYFFNPGIKIEENKNDVCFFQNIFLKRRDYDLNFFL